MAKFKFVGSQEHIEIPEGHERVDFHEEFTYTLNDVGLFALLNEPKEISKWLAPIEKLDGAPGGKIEFADGSEGVCVSFIPGKEVSLLSDHFGLCEMRILKDRLLIDFKILTNDPDQAAENFMHCAEVLRALANA